MSRGAPTPLARTAATPITIGQAARRGMSYTGGRRAWRYSLRYCPAGPVTSRMQKTRKSVAKRFKITGTGKMLRRTPGFRHLLGAKSTKAKRRASHDKLVAPGQAAALRKCLPFGL